MTDLVFCVQVHLCECLLVVVWLEDRIPAEVVFTRWSHYSAVAATNKSLGSSVWSFAESKDALCVGCFVFKALEQLDQSLCLETLEEVFDVGTRKTVERVKTKAHIFNKAGLSSNF